MQNALPVYDWNSELNIILLEQRFLEDFIKWKIRKSIALNPFILFYAIKIFFMSLLKRFVFWHFITYYKCAYNSYRLKKLYNQWCLMKSAVPC